MKRLPVSLLFFLLVLLVGVSTAQLVVVTPPQVLLKKGQTLQMKAYKYLQVGLANDVTNSSTWTSIEPSIATVSKTGLVTMKGTGSALIVASYKNSPGYGTVYSKFTPFISVPPGNGSVGKIQHIVFVVKENRSFDQYFGTVSGRNKIGRAHV